MQSRIKNILNITVILGVTIGLGLPIGSAFAYGPESPECYEISTCDFFQQPFDAMIAPFNATFGGFTYVVLWGIIMGILWLRVSNTMVVGIVGVALAAMFTQGFGDEEKIIGYGLLALALGIAIYQLVIVRVHYPSS